MSKKERSHRMSLIKSKWTKPEMKFHNFLKGNKIRHKMHPRIDGSPDVILKDKKIAFFIHGCFWHKCPKCYKIPSSNKEFWKRKIMINVSRDGRQQRALIKNGWKVMKIWECDIKKTSTLPINIKEKIIEVAIDE